MKTLTVTGVTESIVKYLRVHIIEGVLAPGQKLHELELSSSLGVSRPPLREAFRVLESEHLISSFPRKGCYVTHVSMDNCKEIYEAREMIECFAVDLLKEKEIGLLPAVTETLAVTAGLSLPSGDDPYEKFDYLKAIANFHRRLVESAGNSRLNSFYQGMFPSLARYQSMYTYRPGLMNKSQNVHEEIVQSIEEGDYDHAKEMLRAHIRGFISLMEDKIGDKI